MRVFFATLGTATALLLNACTEGTEGSTLQRGRSAESNGAPAAKSPSGSGDSNASPTPASTPAPATPPAADTAPAASDAGAVTTPATTPATTPPESCGNPKCLAGNGFGGCKATDSAGDVVTMGCQDGACACFAGGQTNAAFDGVVTSADDAAQLFLANCTCN